MTNLKMQFEMARLMQEFESTQLAIAYALGGKVEKNKGGVNRTVVDGEYINNMEQMMSMFHTIGGKIGS